MSQAKLYRMVRILIYKIKDMLCSQQTRPQRLLSIEHEKQWQHLFSPVPFSAQVSAVFQDASRITDHLWIGSCINAADEDWIRNNDIRVVCNVTTEVENFFEETLKLKYFNMKSRDTVEQLQNFCIEEAQALAKELSNCIRKKENVLIHCFFGRSRSVAIGILCMMILHQKTPEEAYILIKKQRPVAGINAGFFKAIQALHEDLIQTEKKIK